MLRTTLLFAFCAVLLPSAVLAECGRYQEGRCCMQDSDCAAYASRSMCAVMAFTKTKIAELTNESAPGMSFCTEEIMAKLRQTATEAHVVCLKNVCEIFQDNG